MIRISHFAAPLAIGTALFLGVQGCTHDRADEIPASAAELSAGTETVSATAPRDGTFYVWDQTANKMLYEGKVDRGESVAVDAKHNRILLNNRVMTKREDLVNDHHYKIFFDRSELDRERDRTLERDRLERDRLNSSDRTLREEHTTIVTPAPAPAGGTTVVTPPATPGSTVTDPNAGKTTIRREEVIQEKRD